MCVCAAGIDGLEMDESVQHLHCHSHYGFNPTNGYIPDTCIILVLQTCWLIPIQQQIARVGSYQFVQDGVDADIDLCCICVCVCVCVCAVAVEIMLVLLYGLR